MSAVSALWGDIAGKGNNVMDIDDPMMDMSTAMHLSDAFCRDTREDDYFFGI